MLALVGSLTGACSPAATRAETPAAEIKETGGLLPAAEKNGTGELRTDLDPLTKRFAAIASPSGAVWMSGTTGDDRAPGPSTYWIDAVITLDPSTAEKLRTEFAAVPTNEIPAVVDGLVESLPSGPLLTSDELRVHTDGAGYGGQAFIAANSDHLVIIKVGGPN